MKRLSKNLLSLFTADIARRLLGFISVAYLARILGKESFGTVYLGFAVLAYIMVLSGAGFPTLGTKKIAQGESAELVGQVIAGRFITTVLVFLIDIGVVLLAVQNSTVAWIIVLFSCAVLPQIFFVDWFFQGKETLGIVSVARVAQALVYLAVVLIFVRSAGDMIWVPLGSIAGECAASALLFLRFRTVYPGVPLHLKPSLSLLKQSMPLAVGIILTTLVTNYPSFALGIFKTMSDVGTYSAASKPVYFLLMGDRVLILLLLPASVRKFSDDPDKFRRMLTDAMRWILIMSMPVALGGILIASKLIPIIYGVGYESSIPVFQVFIWYFFVTMLHTVYLAGLIGVNEDKSFGNNMLVTAVLYLLTVTAGVYWWGPMGAACGVVLSETASVFLMRHALQRTISLPVPEKIIRVILSVAVMGASVAGALPYGLVAGILTGIVCYSIMLFLSRAVVWDDVKTLLARFS